MQSTNSQYKEAELANSPAPKFPSLLDILTGIEEPSTTVSDETKPANTSAPPPLKPSGLSNLNMVPPTYCNWFVDQIEKWIECCDLHHGAHCKPVESPTDTRPRFLIDVFAACVVPLETAKSELQYVALSYVWGPVKTFKTTRNNLQTLQAAGALKEPEIESHIPRTIKDAIELVKKLRMHYLWVDALCIVQDDEEWKHAELERMGGIYSGAALTIVAAFCSDANAGITFGDNPYYGRPLTYETKIKPKGANPGFKPYQMLLKRSPWGGRAWTFQELLFSKRLIYFLR
jgi:hypothetical protein